MKGVSFTVPVAIIERRTVEISDRSACDVAERVIRAKFDLGDATEVSPGGLLRNWQRDGQGGLEAVDGKPASFDQISALRVAMVLRHAWQNSPAP